MPSHGSREPQRPTPISSVGRARGDERRVQARRPRPPPRGCCARSKRWKSTTTRSRMPSSRPLPSTRWLRHSTSPAATSPISSASVSRVRRERAHLQEAELAPAARRAPPGSPRTRSRPAPPIPRSPSASSVASTSASGKTPCFRIGAKVTSRTPGPREAVVDRVVLGRVGRADRARACRRPRPPRARSASSRIAVASAPGALERQRPELALRGLERPRRPTRAADVARVARPEAQARRRPRRPPGRARAPPPRCRPRPRSAASGRSCASARRRRSRDRSASPCARADDPLQDHRHLLLLEPVRRRRR